jgi:hypothetical protein
MSVEEPPPKQEVSEAVKQHLGRGIAEGVGNTLASLYGDKINFQDPAVMETLDEIEREFLWRGRQFFTQIRAEAKGMGMVERDRLIRAAVRIFREAP